MALPVKNCNDIQLTTELQFLEVDLPKIHKWVNGSETETVNLGGVNTATIRNLVKNYWRTATRDRLGVVQIGSGLSITEAGLLAVAFSSGSGLSLDKDGNLTIDPSAWSAELTAEIMKQIRVPFWLGKNTDFYVNSLSGSNSNSGLAEGAAWKDPQYAYSYIAENYNLGSYTATIHLAAGIYTGVVTLPKYNSSTGRIILSGAGIDSTILKVENDSIFASIISAGTFTITNMTLSMTNTAGTTAAARSCFSASNSISK